MLTATVIANLIIAGAYLVIAVLIGNGLVRTRQLGRRNPLATATVGIFLSCGVGHLIHAEHFALAAGGAAPLDWHLALADGVTAVAGVVYLSLRGSFPALWGRTEMFPDRVREEMDRRLREAETLFRTAFEGAPSGVALVAFDGTFVDVNEAYARTVGRSREAMRGLPFAAITHPDDLADDERLAADTAAGRIPGYRLHKRYVRPDGSVVPVLLSVSLVRDDDDVPAHFVVQIVDLTEVEEATAAADAASDRFRRLYGSSPIGIAVIGGDGTITSANPALVAMLGTDPTGEAPLGLFAVEDHPAVATILDDGGVTEARLVGAADGSVAELHAIPSPQGDDGRLLQLVDITERIIQENRLRELADQDALTGLLNRRRFNEEVLAALGRSRVHGGGGAVLLCDLDGFKVLNDSLGHAVGDRTLTVIAAALRAVAPSGSTLARIGGDEFALLLPGADRAHARQVAETLVGALRHRRRTADDHPVVTASIGITMFNGAEEPSVDDLMVQADLAMYDAKAAGRDRVAFYDPESGVREATQDKQRWLDRLRDPAPNLVAYQQAIVPIGTGDGVQRMELLVRFRDEHRQLIAPDRFLPLAEQAGLIGRIDRWMLEQAVALIRTRGHEIAVNVSAQTFVDPDLPAYLRELLGRDSPAGSLLIEVTETAALHDTDVIGEVSQRLRELGCRIALDDFGSGFATFAHLGRLHADVLKVDGRFVSAVLRDHTSRLIVQAIVAMADGMGIPVIAEHVEDRATLAVLKGMGVRYAQGFLFGVPAPIGADPALR